MKDILRVTSTSEWLRDRWLHTVRSALTWTWTWTWTTHRRLRSRTCPSCAVRGVEKLRAVAFRTCPPASARTRLSPPKLVPSPQPTCFQLISRPLASLQWQADRNERARYNRPGPLSKVELRSHLSSPGQDLTSGSRSHNMWERRVRRTTLHCTLVLDSLVKQATVHV